MGTWIIERLANNLETITGAFDILSGVRRIFFSAILLTFAGSLLGCSYSIRERTDAIGDSTTSYTLSWGEDTTAPVQPPRQHVSRRRALRAEQDREVASSPLAAKWYK